LSTQYQQHFGLNDTQWDKKAQIVSCSHVLTWEKILGILPLCYCQQLEGFSQHTHPHTDITKKQTKKVQKTAAAELGQT
jgi:hypothetical protein